MTNKLALVRNAKENLKGNFLLFYGFNHYEESGWGDFQGRYESELDAQTDYLAHFLSIKEKEYPSREELWGHIVDLSCNKIIRAYHGETVSDYV